MYTISQPVDAIICFAGGLYPDTNLPNHLSLSRLLQVDDFLEGHRYQFNTTPTVVFCGGQINYHTGVQYASPLTQRNFSRKSIYHRQPRFF
jgi:hypothetical protein